MTTTGAVASHNRAGKAVPGIALVGYWTDPSWVGWTGGGNITMPLGSIPGSPAINDHVFAFFTTDGNAGASWGTPAGWTLYQHWQPGANKTTRVYYKRMSTIGDLTEVPVWTSPENDFCGHLVCLRNLDPVSPVGAVNGLITIGHSADQPVTVPRANSWVLEVFHDISANYGSGPGSPSGTIAGGLKLGYSNLVRWEAASGIFVKGPVGTGSQAVGVGTWGSSNTRYVMALQPPL